MPWAGHRIGLYSSPRRLVLNLALGEAPAQGIPATADVRAGVRDPVTRTGVGTVDRVLRHYSDGARVARVHSAAASLHRPGERDLGYDDVEHALGLARTLRIDLAAGASVGQTV